MSHTTKKVKVPTYDGDELSIYVNESFTVDVKSTNNTNKPLLKVVGATAKGTSLGFNALSDNDSISIGYYSKSDHSGIAIGKNASSYGISSVSLGNSSSATALQAVALGVNAEATDINAVALGATAKATASKAIQLGEGINSTANTLSFGTGTGSGSFNRTIVDANGRITANYLEPFTINYGTQLWSNSTWTALAKTCFDFRIGSNDIHVGPGSSGGTNNLTIPAGSYGHWYSDGTNNINIVFTSPGGTYEKRYHNFSFKTTETTTTKITNMANIAYGDEDGNEIKSTYAASIETLSSPNQSKVILKNKDGNQLGNYAVVDWVDHANNATNAAISDKTKGLYLKLVDSDLTPVVGQTLFTPENGYWYVIEILDNTHQDLLSKMTYNNGILWCRHDNGEGFSYYSRGWNAGHDTYLRLDNSGKVKSTSSIIVNIFRIKVDTY